MNSQAELIRDSLTLLGEMSHAVVMLFYGRLFETDPSLRNLFKIDMREQSRKLVETLAIVAESADRIEELRPLLRTMGRKHATYGVLPEHYPKVRSALLWAFGQALQRNFNAETRAAWNAVLEAVSREMIAGAAEEPHPS